MTNEFPGWEFTGKKYNLKPSTISFPRLAKIHKDWKRLSKGCEEISILHKWALWITVLYVREHSLVILLFPHIQDFTGHNLQNIIRVWLKRYAIWNNNYLYVLSVGTSDNLLNHLASQAPHLIPLLCRRNVKPTCKALHVYCAG